MPSDQAISAAPRDHRSPSVLFLCPDSDTPTGGVLVMYRHVDRLNAAGIAAYILHERPGFRCRWFANTTPVTWAAIRPPGPDDVLVVPEIFGPHLSELSPGTPKVVFNQNAHLTFEDWPPADAAGPYPDPYRSPEVLATIVVSEHSRRYLEHAFPGVTVHRVVNSIGTVTPAGPKEHVVAYMPRKNADHAAQVLGILASRGSLVGARVEPIDGVSYAESLEVLSRARVFLSFGYPEGWGLPALEAMASGCVVVGYDGGGGSEYLSQETGYPVPFGDILSFAQAVSSVLEAITDDPTEPDRRARAGHDFARERYSDRAEEESVLATWDAILTAGGIESVRGGVGSLIDPSSVRMPEPPGLGLFERLAAERDLAIAERDQSRRELDAIRSSRSWRLSEPVRRVATAIKGRRPEAH